MAAGVAQLRAALDSVGVLLDGFVVTDEQTPSPTDEVAATPMPNSNSTHVSSTAVRWPLDGSMMLIAVGCLLILIALILGNQ